MSIRTLLLAGLGTAVLLGTALPARAEWHNDAHWGWRGYEWHHAWHPYYHPWVYAAPPVYAAPAYPVAPPPAVYFGFNIP